MNLLSIVICICFAIAVLGCEQKRIPEEAGSANPPKDAPVRDTLTGDNACTPGSIIDILTLQDHCKINGFLPHGKKPGCEEPFVLNSNIRFNYDWNAKYHGFEPLLKQIHEDSLKLVSEFTSSFSVLTSGGDMGGIPISFGAVCFYNEHRGMIYWCYLNSTRIHQTEAAHTILRIADTIAVMQPCSYNEISTGGATVSLINVQTPSRAFSFIMSTGLPFHIVDNPEYFWVLEMKSASILHRLRYIDSLRWGVVVNCDWKANRKIRFSKPLP